MNHRMSLHLPVTIGKALYKDAVKNKVSLANMVIQKVAQKFKLKLDNKGKHSAIKIPNTQRVTVTIPDTLMKYLQIYKKKKGLTRICEAVYMCLVDVYELPLSALATKHTGRKIKK